MWSGQNRSNRATRAREGFSEALEELTDLLGRQRRESQQRVEEGREPLVENTSGSNVESENRYTEMRRSRSFSPPRASETSASRWSELSRMCLTPPPVGSDSDTSPPTRSAVRSTMSESVRRVPRIDLLQPNDRPEFFLPPFNSTERNEEAPVIGSFSGVSALGSVVNPPAEAQEREENREVRSRNVRFEENAPRHLATGVGRTLPTLGGRVRERSPEDLLREMTVEQICHLLRMRGDLDEFRRTVIQPMRRLVDEERKGFEPSPPENATERQDDAPLSPVRGNLRGTDLFHRESSVEQSLPHHPRNMGQSEFRNPPRGSEAEGLPSPQTGISSLNIKPEGFPVWEYRGTSPMPRETPSAPNLLSGQRPREQPEIRAPPHRERVGGTPPPIPEHSFRSLRIEENPLSPSRVNFRVQIPSPRELPEPAFLSPRDQGASGIPLLTQATEGMGRAYPAPLRPIPVRGAEYRAQRAADPPYNPDYVPMMPGGNFSEAARDRRDMLGPHSRQRAFEDPWHNVEAIRREPRGYVPRMPGGNFDEVARADREILGRPYRREVVDDPWRSTEATRGSERDFELSHMPVYPGENPRVVRRPSIPYTPMPVEETITEDDELEIPTPVLRGMENVKPFDGTKRSAIALTTFLQELDSAMTIYVPGRIKRAANYDRIKASLLRLRLKGEALNTFAGLSDGDRNSYERAEKALKEIYEDQLPPSEIWEKLNNLTQGPQQSVWSLRQEVQYWVERHMAEDPMTARMSEAELKTHAECLKVKMFFSALREDIHTEVAKDRERAADFDTLVSKATEAEKVMRVIKSHKKTRGATEGSHGNPTSPNPRVEQRNPQRFLNRRRTAGTGYTNSNFGGDRRYLSSPFLEEPRRGQFPVPMGPQGRQFRPNMRGGVGPGQGFRGPNVNPPGQRSGMGPNPQGLNPINLGAPRHPLHRGNGWRNYNNMAPTTTQRTTSRLPRGVRPRGGVNANGRYVARSQPL